jgi:hypothetical protein
MAADPLHHRQGVGKAVEICRTTDRKRWLAATCGGYAGRRKVVQGNESQSKVISQRVERTKCRMSFEKHVTGCVVVWRWSFCLAILSRSLYLSKSLSIELVADRGSSGQIGVSMPQSRAPVRLRAGAS